MGTYPPSSPNSFQSLSTWAWNLRSSQAYLSENMKSPQHGSGVPTTYPGGMGSGDHLTGMRRGSQSRFRVTQLTERAGTFSRSGTAWERFAPSPWCRAAGDFVGVHQASDLLIGCPGHHAHRPCGLRRRAGRHSLPAAGPAGDGAGWRGGAASGVPQGRAVTSEADGEGPGRFLVAGMRPTPSSKTSSLVLLLEVLRCYRVGCFVDTREEGLTCHVE